MQSRIKRAHRKPWCCHSSPGISIILMMGIACITTGCKVGPDYCSAPAPIHQRWIDADVDPHVCGQPDDFTQWWNKFNDPTLTQLIASLEQQNFDLRGAAWRIQAARSSRGIAAGSLFPQAQTANGNFTRSNTSTANFDNWGLTMFDAQWELDFWGKFRRNIEGAEGDLQASIATYDDILVSLQGETAAAYIQLRTLRRRRELATNNVKIQEGLLNIVEVQFKNGAVTQLDVTQAKQSLAQTRSLIPPLEAGIRSSKNALCVLLGTTPGQLDHMLDTSGRIPIAPETICAGVPAELLQRRPDIRAAWHSAAAQSASIGVAITDLYPSFIIAGDIGYQSENLSSLFTSRNVVGAVGPSFSWKILNFGRIKNNIRLQEDLLQSNIASYQQTVLTAYQEVENGLINFAKTHDEIAELEVAEQNAIESVKLARIQYENGAIDFNRVFTLALALVTQQDSLAAAKGDLATQAVAVYKGLGGGWQARNSGYSTPGEPFPMEVIAPDAEGANGENEAADNAAPKEALPEPPGEDPAAQMPEDGAAAKPDAIQAGKKTATEISWQSSEVMDLEQPSNAVQTSQQLEPMLGTPPEMRQDHRTPKRELIPRLIFWKK